MPIQLVLLVNLVVTCFMVGLIWLVQIVHYPLFALVGREYFVAYEAKHAAWITWVVLPVMAAELVCAVVLAWRNAELAKITTPSDAAWCWVALGLVIVAWLVTFALSVPQHRVLSGGFDAAAHARLVHTNWLRTLAWTARGIVLFMLTWRTIKA